MPGSVEVLIVGAWGGSVGFGGNDHDLARLLPWLDHPFIRIKGLIVTSREFLYHLIC